MSSYGLDVLAFGAHPDDVELCCGGLLALLSRRGHRVGVVDLTGGEMASRGTPETRATEAAAAARALGLELRENLGLPDTGVDPGAVSQLAAVVGVLRRLRPEIVVAPHSEARHPDHEAASELVSRAVFYAGVTKFEGEPPGERFVPRQVVFYMNRHTFEPSFIVDTTAVAEVKVQAIRCYASQLTTAGGEAPTLVGSPLTLAVVEARDRYYGAMLGIGHGEPFVMRGAVGLVDPIAHFRANPFDTPHLFGPKR